LYADTAKIVYFRVETKLYAVVAFFVDAHNNFGVAKMKFKQNHDPNSRELPFSVLDFL